MFVLVRDNAPFYRVKRGQKTPDIERELNIPAIEAREGSVLKEDGYVLRRIRPFETYESLAAEYGVPAEQLKRVNGGKILHPARKIFIPLL